MTIFQAIILGIVQGLTEFLPVSSSGHLVIVPEIFGLPTPGIGFDVLVHLATLIIVVGYFSRDIFNIICSIVAPKRMSKQEVKYWRRIFVWLVIGSIPAGLAGVLLGSSFEDMFSKPLIVGCFLILTSALLVGSDFALGRVARHPVNFGEMKATDALIVGCFQALAIAPGLSRSGTTIAGGVFLGFDRPTAARFSFLLSIPTILGAFVLKIGDISEAFSGGHGMAHVLGAIVAGLSGLFAISFLMRYVKQHKMWVFALYTFLVGLLVIVLSLA